ncbi:hypothetical protein ['Paenibacillus yunnanensis' Narsing Rao et al. 2020]|uniref:hypothetical protein n=1 Tax=Paenibacillus tengchongensis TaxID=2608684 RepID=UPI001651E40B|nr:hypothetical protein [Paenibacillus tengchongensis]
MPNSTILGQFGLNVAAGGYALLQATIGLQNTGGTPGADCIYTIVRNGAAIFSIRAGSVPAGGFDGVSFSYMDSGLPAGYYAYGLTVSAYSGATPPNIVGPLIFSGLSLSM